VPNPQLQKQIFTQYCHQNDSSKLNRFHIVVILW